MINMTCGQFFLILLGAAPFIWLGIYYFLYRCFPWEKHMKAIRYYVCTNGVDERYTFKQQYKWHKVNHCSHIREETNNLSFKTFKTLFDLNPDAWFVQEEDSFGDRSMYFQLAYRKDGVNIRVIFNKRDFNKYRRWLANRKKVKIYKNLKADKARSIEACQKIIAGAKQDIQKTMELAEKEFQEAKEITEQVKENLKDKSKKRVIEYDPTTKRYRYINEDGNVYEIMDR